jgi:1-acyl-sn-glycerol-3-phosphate acyltransferase
MHRLLPAKRAPRWWSPRLRPWLVRAMAPIRRWMLRSQEQVRDVKLVGLEHLQSALTANHGILLTPNHYCFTDPYILAAAADRVGRPFYYMTAWQAIGLHHSARQMVMRWHGAFSIDRDGPDLQAFKQAVDIIQNRLHPLVIFPEGEMYRISDRVFPFREGTAAIALAAAKRAERQVVCLPCALRYGYLDDPTSELLEAMERIEQRLLLRAQPESPLAERIVRACEGALALKELDYLGHTQGGSAHERAQSLAAAVLAPIEQRQQLTPAGPDLLSRVRVARQRILAALEKFGDDRTDRSRLQADLDDLFFVEQLSCYPVEYDTHKPALHRMAETIDKLEEDILGLALAPPRGPRRATLLIGELIAVDPAAQDKTSLTAMLEARVQALLDETKNPLEKPIYAHAP